MAVLAPVPDPDPRRGPVLTRAVLGAASRLGLSARQLARVIGVSEPTVSRMKKGGYALEDGSKPFELAALLVRVYRSLDAIAGGDETVSKGWMKTANTALDGLPAEKIETVAGLWDVIQYLDARRAPL